jgi:hypothetical protein
MIDRAFFQNVTQEKHNGTEVPFCQPQQTGSRVLF